MDVTEQMYKLAKQIVDEYEGKNKINKIESQFVDPSKFKLVPVKEKEIGKMYFHLRVGWSEPYSDNVIIMQEGGSSRTKGWQVTYTDSAKMKLRMEDDFRVTHFADDDDLYEAIN